MAQARQASRGGMTAVHMWVIGFAFLWLTSTVLLVWLYTHVEGVQSDADQLRRENAKLVRGSDKSLKWYAEASESGPSMASLLEQQRKDTVLLALGEEVEDVDAARAKTKAQFDQIVSDKIVSDMTHFVAPALLPALTTLYEEFKGEHELRLAESERAQTAEAQLQEKIDEGRKSQVAFDETADSLKDKVAEIEAAHAAYVTECDGGLAKLQARLDETRQQLARDVQTERETSTSLQDRLEELQRRFTEAQAKLGELQITPGERITVRQADGRIVQAEPGQDVVYVSLGRRHQLTTGLQFAVYPAEGIPSDGSAKARIEVTEIHENTAAARILAVADMEVIVEGDLIANPVYDPTRPLRFFVVGEFDLNGDGHDDVDGAERIQSLISNWGGHVVDALSSRVDFVVAGFEPVIPQSVGAATRDPVEREREQRMQQKLDEYQQVVDAASQLSIPILTQDVFMRFLGF